MLANNLSISEVEQLTINYYPNPTKGLLNINTNAAIAKIEAYDTLGRKVNETYSNVLDLSNEPNGIYFLRIHSESKIIVKKVIKH